MSQHHVIMRNLSDPDGLDFALLRKEAINLAQNLSGKIWTDYNLHDPGVTILEQICFGLTELAYQASGDIEAYLSDEHGAIDFHKFSLFKPHEILPNSAVTLRDYCKLFIDAMPEVDAVHLVPVSKGVYNIHLKLQRSLAGECLSDGQEKRLKALARQIYLHNRNLGEDLHEIIIDPTHPCFLQINIEIGGRRARAEIVADILFQCARQISSDIRIERYEDAYRVNSDLAQLFDGPLTHRGYIHGQHLNQINNKQGQELNSLVMAIDGVKQIYDLKLVDVRGKVVDPQWAQQGAFHLQLPVTPEQLSLLVISNAAGNSRETARQQIPDAVHQEKNRKLMADARRYLQRLEFEYNAFRTNKSQAASFYPLPSGQAREPLDYFSIQNQFPNIYGINAAGVPSTETNDRKKQAKQLKAYLYPIEQVMANFLQQIQELQNLFNISEKREQSYFSQYLDNRHIPHIDTLYISDSTDYVRTVQAQHDNFSERKNRALNSLLAIYGEEFPEEQLRHFDDYHRGNIDYWMIDNKIHFLAHLVSLSGARARAFDQAELQWQTTNISIVQKKINILLGLSNITHSRPIAQVMGDMNIRLVSNERLLNRSSTRTFAQVDAETLPELTPSQQRRSQKMPYKLDKTISLSESMLRAGVYLSSYFLVAEGEAYNVFLHLPIQQQLVFLKHARNLSKAISYSHTLKRIITRFNSESESFHLVEHLLLRERLHPGAPAPVRDEKPCGADPFADNFFDHQLSVVFPGWTARANNPAFRQYVRQLLNENIPAHLLPEIYWLDFSAMEKFEKLHQQWLTALQEFQQSQLETSEGNPDTLNKCSQRLTAWLKKNRQPQEYWV